MSNDQRDVRPPSIWSTTSETQEFLEEDEEELYEAFSIFKTGPEDVIGTRCFPRLMRLMGQNVTEAEIIQMMREVDNLRSFTITYDKVLSTMRAHFRTPHTEEQLRKAFDVFDRDGSGSLAAAEILYVMHKLGEVHSEEEVKEIFLQTDTDHDMKITVEDFINIMGRSDDGEPRMTMPRKFKLM